MIVLMVLGGALGWGVGGGCAAAGRLRAADLPAGDLLRAGARGGAARTGRPGAVGDEHLLLRRRGGVAGGLGRRRPRRAGSARRCWSSRWRWWSAPWPSCGCPGRGDTRPRFRRPVRNGDDRRMIRSILVALDDTDGAQRAARPRHRARAPHRRRADRRHRARLAACAATRTRPCPPAPPPSRNGATPPARSAPRRRPRLAFAACTAAAGEAPFTRLRLTDAPEPALLAAGAAHDLIVIGRDSTLGLEDCPDGLAPVIEALLHDGARPLLVVPPGPPATAAACWSAMTGRSRRCGRCSSSRCSAWPATCR